MASQMHNLTTLIKRLEAATSRLEDMATSTFADTNGTQGLGGSQIGDGTTSAKTTPPPKLQTPIAPIAPLIPESVAAFDDLVKQHVDSFITKASKVGELVAEQAKAVKAAFMAERKILYLATLAKKPDITTPLYMEILKDLQQQMETVNSVKISNPTSPHTNHLQTVVEGVSMLGWITIEPKPADYVKESKDSAMFWGNRVTKEYKEKDPNHTEWLKSFYGIFTALQEYINKWHAQGVTWNYKNGIEPGEALKQVTTLTSPTVATFLAPVPPPPAGAGGPPPPPPPPPPPASLMNPPNGASAKNSEAAGGDMGAVFEQLNKGEAVTSGLKKVDPSMQTHKNPALRSKAPAPPVRSDSASSRGKSSAPGRPMKPESMRTKKPPRKELDGNKWYIENYENHQGVIEIEAGMNHSILISKCNKTVIKINGKANAVSIDSSTRLSLVVDSLVSSVDVIKSPRLELQVLEKVPVIMLDQVDGATVYLSEQSLSTEVFSSKCSSINISVPEGSEGDSVELPLPEQIVTRIQNGKAVSEIVEHAG